ncbi:SusC/RagA family TonB-linked outer membrane protein [Sphingobacterium detergens]
MKFILLFMFLMTLGSKASVYAQRVTLTKNNLALEDFFKEVKKQTNYRFVLEEGLLQNSDPISVHLKDASLDKSMQEALKNQPFSYQIFDGSIVIKAIEPRHERQHMVKGKITDNNNTPLVGASIKVLNSNKATASDINGTFEIQANLGEMIQVSFIGFTSKTIKIESSSLAVILNSEDRKSLDEVVVIGLGNTQRKISVVGAISTITTKELTQSPVANLSNALAGRLPGLITRQGSNVPGAGSDLYIRGISSMTGSTAPLIIVDGLPRTSGDFAQLDPNEIESVSILKDASSTSLYGIQGANGVVVVTTKRGIKDQKPEINFTGQYALQQPIRLPKMMDAEALALFDNETYSSTVWTEQDIQNIRSGSDPYTYPYINWFDYLLKDHAPQQNYNTNFRGGSQFAKYFVSGSYLNQGALFDKEEDNEYNVKTNFKRYNFRSNIDLQVTKRLTLQVDVAGRLEKQTGPGPGVNGLLQFMNQLNPNVTGVFNPDGSIAHGGKVSMANDWNNPYGMLTKSGYYDNSLNAMNGTFLAKHMLDFITEGLSLQGLITFQNINFRNTSRTQNYNSYWYRGLDDKGVPIYQQARVASNLATSGDGGVERRNYLDLRLNYERQFGRHQVSGQVLGNRTLRINQDELPFAYQGISSRFTYGFDDRYFAEFNLGYNGSENFPPKKRYGIFPSLSAGWVVTNENFYHQNNILDYLKIRGSLGWVGNDQIGNSRWLYISDYASGGGYNFGPNANGNGGGYNENRVGNPNVTWEKSRKLNIGFDATFANKIFNLTFDYFKENRKDILLSPGTVPSYVGVSGLAPRNTGEVMNHGFDGILSFNKLFGEFRLFGNIQATYSRNEIRANDQPIPAFPYQQLVGHEIGYSLGYQALGLFTSEEEIENSPKQSFASTVLPGDIKYADINGDGIVNANDRIPVQNHNIPRYVFGFSIGGDYKGFDFSVLLNGATGSTTNIGAANFDYLLRGREVWNQRWNEETNNSADALLPSARRSSNNTQFSNFWIMNTDYLKLRNAEIGYKLSSTVLAPYGIKSLRIFVNGQNLGLWDKMWMKEQDPESAQNVTYYPQQRVINFGVSLTL